MDKNKLDNIGNVLKLHAEVLKAANERIAELEAKVAKLEEKEN